MASSARWPRSDRTVRNVLVTGGGRRIGRAIVERLADAGWSVAVHHNMASDEAHATATAIRAKGVQSIAIGGDLTDDETLRDIFAVAGRALGPLTAVVNNASVFQDDPADLMDRRVWDRHMAVHVRAPYVLSRLLADNLPDDAEGAVVNLVDQRVLNPTKHFPSYAISKMALWDETQTLARTLAPRVRVNAVGPGPVLPSTRQSMSDFELQAGQTPLGRIVDPREIADAVAYLLDARAITGQIIAVDSGQHLNWAFETAETAPRE